MLETKELIILKKLGRLIDEYYHSPEHLKPMIEEKIIFLVNMIDPSH